MIFIVRAAISVLSCAMLSNLNRPRCQPPILYEENTGTTGIAGHYLFPRGMTATQFDEWLCTQRPLRTWSDRTAATTARLCAIFNDLAANNPCVGYSHRFKNAPPCTNRLRAKPCAQASPPRPRKSPRSKMVSRPAPLRDDASTVPSRTPPPDPPPHSPSYGTYPECGPRPISTQSPPAARPSRQQSSPE